MKPPMRFRRQYNTHYTDLAVVIGPDVRWTEDDADDLQNYYPEVLLGFRVVLATVEDVRWGMLRGRRVHTAIVLDNSTEHPSWTQAYRELIGSMMGTPGHPTVQYWWVHRHRFGVSAVKSDWR